MSLAPLTARRPADAVDTMPLNGVDHIELYVGNAAQAAYYYIHAFGFTQVAYAGLETGSRERTSHVLEQGRVRLVLTGALDAGSEVAAHAHAHGDGVKVIGLSVPDAAYAYRTAVERGARGVVEPREEADEHGKVVLATIATYGETVHTFVERGEYTGPFLPGYAARSREAGDVGLLAIDHIVGNVELGHMQEWVELLRARLRHDGDAALLRRGDLDGVLRADVQGRHGRQGPREVPDQRARRGQAQVTDRRVPRVLRRAGRAAHRRRHPRHRPHGHRAARARRRVPHDPGLLLRGRPDPIGEIEESLEDLRRLGILVDRDDEGYMLQIFTKPVGDRPTVFFEVIERHGARRLRRGELQGALRGDRA
jgi:4-hydroxyphenylpyruvate dioxygenase